MNATEIFKIILLLLLIVCAISVNLTKKLLPAVIIFMSYSTIMAIVWALLESPDLAITEAAVGAGVTSILFFLTLRKLSREEWSDPADEDEANTTVLTGPAASGENENHPEPEKTSETGEEVRP